MPFYDKEVILKNKLIVIPTIVVMIAILAAGFTSYWISRYLLLQQLEREGYNYAELLIWQVESQSESWEQEEQTGGTVHSDENGNAALFGIQPDRIQQLTEKFAKKNQVEYALIIDKDLVAVADSDREEIGWHYGDDVEYQRALAGYSSAVIWHYPRTSQNV